MSTKKQNTEKEQVTDKVSQDHQITDHNITKSPDHKITDHSITKSPDPKGSKATSKKKAASTAKPADAPAHPITDHQITKSPDHKITDQRTSIVIPYLASKAKGDELRYAVRAWAKHFPEGNIVIIGDKPPWAGKDLVHIPHKPQDKNPQIDVAHKMVAAIASKKVSDVFVWTNDDIYTLCPVDFADIITLKSHGKLLKRGVANGIYADNCKNTVTALKKQGVKDPFDYATHTPVVMEKSSLAKVIERYGCDKEGHLVYSLYANTVFPNHRPIITKNDGSGSICASVYRANPDPKILKRVIASRKWLNNNDAGWKAVEPALKVLFADKCKFEK
ncbi:hypothetical protein GCM10027284_08960 [Cyclobacterium sediminis]